MDDGRNITTLPGTAFALPAEDRARFDRIFRLTATVGTLMPPDGMHPWLIQQFGSVDGVRRQEIFKITNLVTLEGTLFNALRARRPVQAPIAAQDFGEQIDQLEHCDFCSPKESTPADVFGRIRGQHCITASNVAKCDGWHGIIVFDEHNPLRFTASQVADYVDAAQQWAQRAHQAHPAARYPLLLWNCLWRSGASILHGHAQMVLTCDMHYARVESWRQAAIRYRQAYNANYFSDLIAVHHALGLAVDHGTATILPSLTPLKEKETYIVAPQLDDDAKSALYRVLNAFIERLDVQSFNLALYQPPLSGATEDWEDFPYIFRILDRGNLNSTTSDVGAMEFFAQSVVATDPFHVAGAMQTEPWEEIT